MAPKKDLEATNVPIALSVLIKRKERCFEQIQAIFDLSKNINDDQARDLFLLRINEIDTLKSTFEKIIFDIFEKELENDQSSLLHSQDLKNFEDLYYRTKLVASKYEPNCTSNKEQVPSTESKPRLPKLELFHFDGEIENFTTFYETFCSLVHNQSSISKIDKFHYLLSCTKGSALNIVKSVPISASNYDVVWQSLLNKYQDKRMLVGRYLDKMLNFTPLNKETSAHLNTFIENFEHSYKAIEALNIDNLGSYILCHIALRALDPQSRKSFEQQIDQNSIPGFTDLVSFVHNHIKVLDHSASYSCSNNSTNQNQNKKQFPKNKQYKAEQSSIKNYTHASSNSKKVMLCAHCGENHMIYRCSQFRKLTSAERVSRAASLNLCKSCLKTHEGECTSTFLCAACQNPHHFLLHIDGAVAPSASNAAKTVPPRSASISDNTALMNHASSMNSYTSVVLGTAIVRVKDKHDSYQPCRVLIDSGAQSNFISIACMQRLGLSQRKCPFNIFGLAGESVKNHGMTSFNLMPRHNDTPNFNIDAVVLTKLTSDLPTVKIPQNTIKEYNNLFLADPQFYKSSPIDIILAGDIFPHVYDGKKIIFDRDIPAALSSVFGYVISGKLAIQPSSNNVVTLTTSLVSYTCEDDRLHDTLKKFWEVESTPCETPMSPSEEIAEKLYIEKHYRDETGRYVSPILINPDHEPLGDSYDIALKRLNQIERRLARSPDLRAAYVDFMREYESLGHMELYTGTEPSKYIIPHHCVLRPSSTSTPLRVVYNGSSPTTSGVSLNDILLTGRKLHNDISNIILNFRLYDVCFTADVSKMYRGILIDPSERNYQHILWRETPSEPVRIYELKTNTYGLRSAPYVAVRTLHQLALDNSQCRASAILTQGFYVDDLLWSCQTITEACALQEELMCLLKSGGFELKKWASNSPEFLQRLNTENISNINFEDDTLSNSLKVLGLTWLPSTDCFSFNYNLTDIKFTKRSVLTLLASIFDPVGFISPCTFLAKCIMQDLWKLGLGWDDSLPIEIYEKWSIFIRELPTLADVRIERHLLIPNFSNVHVIGFCDASSRGYAACVYLRSVDKDGRAKVRLLISKSKVAPLKPILSIPRLELMAAVLLAKSLRFVIKNLTDFIYTIVAFSDSSVVLSWLQTPPYQLKTFVSNRVSEIIDVIPPNRWYHVSSENNAADLCSRGTLPSQFLAVEKTWLHGPEWLLQDPSDWPTSTFFVKNKENIPELKSNVDTFSLPSSKSKTLINDLEETFEKFSSFNRLQRAIGWCHRFINNLKSRSNRTSGPLNTSELKQSRDTIVHVIQSNHFGSEIEILNKKGYVASLRKLSPFVDPNGFLRVGGRISQSDLPYDTKHPLLLPKKCHTVILLIEYFHKVYLHSGPRTLQGILCKTYWIINARSVLRSVLSKCANCFKFNPNIIQPLMGSLPASRLKPGKVFDQVGCDIGGPFYVKESQRRNAKSCKSYLCLFVCFATKAVHLEVLTDLTCDCFLAAVDRLVSRRGLCSCLFSDCGRNLIAAAKHLKEVGNFFRNKTNCDAILNGLALRSIDWRTNPPSAAAMGGLWESGIKSAKQHLYRTIGARILTFEELNTIFCKIEAMMNSRPLCSLSNNPNEFDVLTAGHFLIGQSLLAVPEYDVEDVPLNRLSRWQALQKITQSFWKRWSDDYVHTLQQREKWFSSKPNVNVGDLVLLKSDLAKPLQWPLGRIVEIHPGVDNIVRVVTVRTKTGLYKRPVNKICPLPYAN